VVDWVKFLQLIFAIMTYRVKFLQPALFGLMFVLTEINVTVLVSSDFSLSLVH
jgi:hypothetical protein